MGTYQLPCEIFDQSVYGLALKFQNGRPDASLLAKNWEYGYPSMFERFYFKTSGGRIFVFDLFSGTFRSLTTTLDDAGIRITKCLSLVGDRCLVIYQQDQKVHMSIVSVDLNTDKCTFIGNSYRIPNCWKAWWVGAFVDPGGILITKVPETAERTRLYLFKVDISTPKFELQAALSIPAGTDFHHIIDEHCIFAKFESTRAWIEHIVICNKNGSLIKLDGTGIQLDYNAHKLGGRRFGYFTKGCWHGNNLFVSYTASNSSYIAITSLFAFQLNRRKWIEIRLGSLVRYTESFTMSSTDNGIMMLNFRQNTTNDPTSISSFILCRVPLTSPETLFDLCWFKRNKFPLCKTANVYGDQ